MTIIAWQGRFPPKSNEWIDVPAEPLVQERGVAAWTFVENERMADTDDDSNAAVMDRTTVVFCQGQGCVLTNLPLPRQEFVYWEVKVLQLDDQDRLAIGLATKPYPGWRLPGWHRHSVAYHSHTGAVHASDPFIGRPYGPPFKEGDVVGVGYLSNTSTVFFTRNGKNLGKASIGFKFPVYPAIGAAGPCQVAVNFGQQEFLFSPANLREAALAPKQGTLPPPPAYGDTRNTIMLFGASEIDDDSQQNNPHLDYSHQSALAEPASVPPPRYT
ncbi:SPRY-domain-containing protein [Lichtheimia hyalospora FSU 10163]|nr:SPRY-domain-containing protein [Lichtheimia hyalospora FSU 10163]